MTLLISGATGTVGGRVAERLIAEGLRPRILVRDIAKARTRFGDRADIVVGDFADEPSLEGAMAGVEAALLITGGPELERYDACAARAARAVGVGRLVKLSSLGARANGEATAVALWHARGEAAIRASGVPFTFVQSVGFMTNTLAWARTIKSEGVVRASTGEGRIAMIDPDDIAAVAVKALTTPEYEGESIAITGPEALTYAEMTARIGAAIGRPLQFQAVSDEQAREALGGTGMPADLVGALVTLWREVRAGRVAAVTDGVRRVTGRAPGTFEAWAAQNADAFR